MNKFILILALLFLAGCSTVAVTPEEVTTQDHLHSKVHDSNLFVSYNTDTGVAAAGTSEIHLKTNGRIVHFVYNVVQSSDGPITIDFLEDVTPTLDGTPLDVINLNRRNPLNATALVYSNPTYTGGKVIDNFHIPSGNKDLSLNSELTHYILKSNTSYVLRVTNDNGNGVDIYSRIKFYEN